MPALRSRILLIGLALGAALAWLPAPYALAADPQPYSVHFASTGNGALNTLLRASSQLDSLRKSAPVSPFALVDRAQQDIGRLQSALQSYGYYESSALISIEGHTLYDPDLPSLLAALPRKRIAKVEVRFQLGPLYRLGAITVQGGVSPGATAALKLKSGDPAVAQDVLDARVRLLNALEEEGHAFATVDDPPGAILQQTTRTLDVNFNAHPGAVYTLGPISFEGLKLVKEPFVRSQIAIHTGDRYRASAIEQARQTLLNLGVFAVVSVRVPPAEQVKGTVLPLTFVVNERKPHAVTLDGEYSSDLGVIASAGWTDRNLFGRADQLGFNASVFGLGGNGTATNGVSYDLTAQLTLPDFLAPTQSLQFELQALKPELTAYTQIAAIGGVTLARKLSSVWNVSAGLSLEEEKIQQNEVVECQRAINSGDLTTLSSGAVVAPPAPWCHYLLFSVPLTARYDSTDLANPLVDPLHGMRAQVLLTPTETLYGKHATFAMVQANLSAYFDLSSLSREDPGRSVLAVRALVGRAFGTTQFGLPADLRFYAGGSATVRGYAYQGLGPTFPLPEAVGEFPEGGTGITAGTLEFRQRVWGNFGFGLFVDAGAVTSAGSPAFFGQHRICPASEPTESAPSSSPPPCNSGVYGIGYGGGPRYYTPIGPIRVDVAFPLIRQPGGDAFEAYIGLGQAF